MHFTVLRFVNDIFGKYLQIKQENLIARATRKYTSISVSTIYQYGVTFVCQSAMYDIVWYMPLKITSRRSRHTFFIVEKKQTTARLSDSIKNMHLYDWRMTFLMTLSETMFRNVSRLTKRVYCHASRRMAAALILLLMNTIPQIVQCACSVAWISQVKIKTEWRSWMEMWSFSWVRYKFRETDPNNFDLIVMQNI